MKLNAGFRLGPYEILSPLGAGGMGEVYRARDTKLDRDVALKVLPEAFVNNPERRARFQREARVLASLNHPNIAAIYGLEESGAVCALVLELVEGPTLAEHIATAHSHPPRSFSAKGRLAPATGASDGLRGSRFHFDEVLPIARQVADALEYAHERGIVHRDLKPANVKITPEGMVKVLDFGIAKALQPSATSSPEGPLPLQDLPTLTLEASQEGEPMVGTPSYMAPEQAMGKPVDRRADIWAFGCVLYEMLSGKRTFKGEKLMETFVALMHNEPDWEALPVDTPPSIRKMIRRCLTKDPKQRLRDIGDARIAIEETISGTGTINEFPQPGPPAPLHSSLKQWLPWTLGIACALLAGALIARYIWPPVAVPPTRSLISPPEKVSFAFEGLFGRPILSPDGTMLVFPARDETGRESLWKRPMDSLNAKRIEGTEGASFPFWSHDGRRIGFFQNEELKKIDVAGGPVVKLCNTKNPRGGTWGRDDVIVFASLGLFQVPAAGGTPRALIARERSGKAYSNRWPIFLPDGRHFLYLSGNLTSPGTPNLGIYMGSLDTDEVTFVVQADSEALYASPGYLLFLRGSTLMTQPFDADSRRLKGEALPLAEKIASPLAFRLGLFTVSQAGLLIYQKANVISRQFVLLDTKGKQVGTVSEAGVEGDPSLSPDGKHLAFVMQNPQGNGEDIWVIDLNRNTRTRVTYGESIIASPVWSPDGGRIVYSRSSQRTGLRDLYVKNGLGAGKDEVLFASATNKYPFDWSRDGRYILFISADPKAKGFYSFDLWALPLFGDRKPFPYLHTKFDEAEAAFSPDSHWVAYGSNESGHPEVYLSPFPVASSKLQVSQGGGTQPRWKLDGSALYFLGPDGRLMQVSVKKKSSTLEIGVPHELFQSQMADTQSGERAYSVMPGGKRFLVTKHVQNPAPPLTLVTDWLDWLRGMKE